MTTTGVDRTERGRLLVVLLAAFAALAALLLPPAPAPAATAQAAEKGVGAIYSESIFTIGVHHSITAGQHPVRGPSQLQLVSGHCVDAEDVTPIKAGTSGGMTAGKVFPQSVKDAAIDENLAATGGDVPTCVWCHMETETPHIDHAWPRSLGGDATLENAQVACPHCNLSRGNGPYPVTPPIGYRGAWPPAWWPW